MKRKIIGLALVLALAALLVYALLPAPLTVTAVKVHRGHFVEYVEDEGRTQLREPHTVSAPINGYLRRVEHEPGDSVAINDTLFRIEALPTPALDARSREQAREAVAAARARLEAARAELDNRQTELELARLEHDRSHILHERGAISSEERDRRRIRHDAARAAERAARHAVDVAAFELEAARAVIEIADGERSPGDQPTLDVPASIFGTITQRHRWSEGPISAGEPILQIGNLDDLEVRVDLLSMDAVRVQRGMRTTIERWGGEHDLQGQVRRIDPAGFARVSALGVDERRVPVLVQITSPREQWSQLGDGYRVEARFILWEADDVTQIPTSALFRHNNGRAVYVAENGRATIRQVETGRRSGLWTQVESGLEAGEIVIAHPDDRLTEGARVAPDIRDYR